MIASPPAREKSSEPWSHRIALYATAVFCLLAIPVELGWVRYFRYAWGFNLWQYLFAPLALLLAVLLAVLCLPAARVELLNRLSERRALSGRRLAPLVWVAILFLPLLLWMVRERSFLGDSKILLFTLAARDTLFYFPDVGATFLMKSSFDLGRSLGWGGLSGLQALVCLCAWPALLCFTRVGGYLAPSRGWAAFATALMILGGIPRIYAGHIEVYAIVLIGVGGYFWASLAYLRGRCSWRGPCLALGLGLWIHFCFLFFIPSLLALPLIVEPPRPLRQRIGQWTRGLALVGLPLTGFFVILLVVGQAQDLMLAWTKVVTWSEVGSGREHYETVWIQPPWSIESGTKYTLYSRLHLKFLANSFFLLAPATIPVVLAYALFSTRRLWATPEAAFLSAASVPMLVYASMVRPVFGPYEWDLFTVTAVCLTALAAHLLANTPTSTSLAQLCLLLIAATLLLVTIPWVLVGAHVHNPAGPFAIDALHAAPDGSFYEPFVRKLEPWL